MHAASASYNDNWLIKGYFISFVILTAIVSFNVFVAVLTSQVHEKFISDQKVNKTKLTELQGDIQETEQEVQEGFQDVMKELRLLRAEVEALKNQRGKE